MFAKNFPGAPTRPKVTVTHFFETPFFGGGFLKVGVFLVPEISET